MILISPRPDDPVKVEHWVESMVRIQVAMWVDEGAACDHCKRPYVNIDDFLMRRPRYAGTGPKFVDDACWNAWGRVMRHAGSSRCGP